MTFICLDFYASTVPGKLFANEKWRRRQKKKQHSYSDVTSERILFGTKNVEKEKLFTSLIYF